MHVLGEGLHVLDRRVRQHAVAEIEDVAGATAHGFEQTRGLACDDRGRGIEKDRIEQDYRAGVISYDRKRGQKMLVTRRTEGRV